MTSIEPTRVADGVSIRSAQDVAAHLSNDATLLVSGFGSVGYPKGVPEALARSDRELDLTIISGGSVGRVIDSELAETNAIARRCPFVARDAIRSRINDGHVAFQDRHISTLGDDVAFQMHSDHSVAVVEAVAVGPDWLIPSTSIGHTPQYVKCTDELIVEVNDAQPLALRQFHDVYRLKQPPARQPVPLTDPADRIGGERIRFDAEKLIGVVQTSRPDQPYSFREPSSTENEIIENLASFLIDEMDRHPALAEAVHLQFGVGSLGNALTDALELVDFEGREVSYYGEVIQDGLLDLLDKDILTGASATSLALSEGGQERLFDEVQRYAEDIVLRPANLSNNPALIDRFGVVAVNSAVELDIYGNVNSTHIGGTDLLSGIGGSGDFNRNALLSIVALPSTVGGGEMSKIVPMVTHVDHTEHDVSVIVTEHGVADLRGCSPRERAERIIEDCAHPDYRPALREYFERAESAGGNTPHDLDNVFDWREGHFG